MGARYRASVNNPTERSYKGSGDPARVQSPEHDKQGVVAREHADHDSGCRQDSPPPPAIDQVPVVKSIKGNIANNFNSLFNSKDFQRGVITVIILL